MAGREEGLEEGVATEEGLGAGGCEEGSNRTESAATPSECRILQETSRRPFAGTSAGNGGGGCTLEAEVGLAVAGKGEADLGAAEKEAEGCDA